MNGHRRAIVKLNDKNILKSAYRDSTEECEVMAASINEEIKNPPNNGKSAQVKWTTIMIERY